MATSSIPFKNSLRGKNKERKVFKKKSVSLGNVRVFSWTKSARVKGDKRWLRDARWKKTGGTYDKTGQSRMRRGKVNIKAHAQSSTLTVNIRDWRNVILIPILMQTFKSVGRMMERDAKKNAPWKDITGKARRGLNASVDRKGKEVKLRLSHSVKYGKYLERGHRGFKAKKRILGRTFGKTFREGKKGSFTVGRKGPFFGKYQIIQPTMRKWTKRFWILIRKSLGERGGK